MPEDKITNIQQARDFLIAQGYVLDMQEYIGWPSGDTLGPIAFEYWTAKPLPFQVVLRYDQSDRDGKVHWFETANYEHIKMSARAAKIKKAKDPEDALLIAIGSEPMQSVSVEGLHARFAVEALKKKGFRVREDIAFSPVGGLKGWIMEHPEMPKVRVDISQGNWMGPFTEFQVMISP